LHSIVAITQNTPKNLKSQNQNIPAPLIKKNPPNLDLTDISALLTYFQTALNKAKFFVFPHYTRYDSRDTFHELALWTKAKGCDKDCFKQ